MNKKYLLYSEELKSYLCYVPDTSAEPKKSWTGDRSKAELIDNAEAATSLQDTCNREKVAGVFDWIPVSAS